ncbi:hypothetical protein D1AOALGA4SA_12864 [Olavius algarvensis Delta 1 endosymbiont]|nr:hypothetical protein D1AOALGA4SA_12864 [Olavius algarvensis Delta 1 endosymbiont]
MHWKKGVIFSEIQAKVGARDRKLCNSIYILKKLESASAKDAGLSAILGLDLADSVRFCSDSLL